MQVAYSGSKGQISHIILSHYILGGGEGLGEGCVKIMLIVSYLEWLTCLFLFIIVDFKSYYTALT